VDGSAQRVLIVSTVELGGAAVEALVGEDAVTMIVVPQVRQSRLQWLANDEDRAHEIAQRASERLAVETPGMTVAAEAGDSDPRLAIQDALARFAADEIVVVTRPEEEAGWLERHGDGFAAVNGIPVRRAHVAADGSTVVG
jgi:hypothetical protein